MCIYTYIYIYIYIIYIDIWAFGQPGVILLGVDFYMRLVAWLKDPEESGFEIEYSKGSWSLPIDTKAGNVEY